MNLNYLKKIKKVSSLNNSSISYCPERGGIITSIILRGKEILFFDEGTFCDLSVNVRGGVPILFPNAGKLLESNVFPKLKQHGFVREKGWLDDVVEDGFKETLIADSETKALYNFDFKLAVGGNFESDESVTISCEIENLETTRSMPISMGLHPYFRVLDEEKKNIKFNFLGGEEVASKIDVWSNGGTVVIDNPKLKFPNEKIEIIIPDLGSLILDISLEYEKIWVWSLPGKNFICVEPMMRALNGLVDRPWLLKAQAKLSCLINLKLL